MAALAKRPLDLMSSLPLDVSEGGGGARKKLRRVARCGDLAARHDELVDALGLEAPRTGELLSRCLQPVYNASDGGAGPSGGDRQPAAGPADAERENGGKSKWMTNLTSVAVSPPTYPTMDERPPPCLETSPRPSPARSARRALVACVSVSNLAALAPAEPRPPKPDQPELRAAVSSLFDLLKAAPAPAPAAARPRSPLPELPAARPRSADSFDFASALQPSSDDDNAAWEF